VSEPAVRSLIEAMRWVEKFPMPVMGTPEGFGTKSVNVTLATGEKASATVSVAKGMPANPLSAPEFTAKFRDCASTVLSERAVEESLALLTALQGAVTVAKIMAKIKYP